MGYIFYIYSIFESIAIPTSLINSPTSSNSCYNQLLYEQQQILPSVLQDVEKLITFIRFFFLNPSSSLVCLTKWVDFEFCHESARINDDCLTDTYASEKMYPATIISQIASICENQKLCSNQYTRKLWFLRGAWAPPPY